MKKQTPKKTLNKSAGQATTEMILMLVVFLGISTVVTTAFKNSKFVATLISGPWQAIAGMAQNGVWEAPSKSMNKHPNAYRRWASLKGEDPK
jgi:hypothetical protein